MITIEKGYRISIMLTEACNLKCSHCYMSANAIGKTLSNDEIDYLINNLPINCLRISITGGEPYMCRDKLYYILNKIKNKFAANMPEVRVETNGMFFYYDDAAIIKEVQKLIELGVSTLRLSDDEFHEKGGLDIKKLRNIEKVVKENNLNIVVSTLFQDKAVAFGRAKELKTDKIEKKKCLNRKESLVIPYFYTTIDGEVSTCAWKCAPPLGNCFKDSWDDIVRNLNSPLQKAILNSDIEEAAKLVCGGDENKFSHLKNILETKGQCMACKEMFKGKYE